MQVNKFVTLTVGLVVGVLLVSALMVPVIASLGTDSDSGHYDTSVQYMNMKDSFEEMGVTVPDGWAYKLYVNGVDTLSAKITVTLDDIMRYVTDVSFEEDASLNHWVHFLSLSDTSGVDDFQIDADHYDVKAHGHSPPNGKFDDLSDLLVDDMSSFNLSVNTDWTYSLSLTYLDTPYSFTGEVGLLTYLAPSGGEFVCSFETNPEVSMLYIGEGSRVAVCMENNYFDEVIVTQENLDNGYFDTTPKTINPDGVEAEYYVHVGFTPTEDEGIYCIDLWSDLVKGVEDGVERYDYVQVFLVSEHPYIEGEGGGSGIPSTISTVLSIIPLLTVVGIIIGTIGFIRMKE